jgi:hypothetical protein
MTLDITKPTDEEIVSMLPYWIRQTRAAVEDTPGSEVAFTELDISAGTTSLAVGTDLKDADIEVVTVNSTGAIILATIIGGTKGQLKILIFQNSQVSIIDGVKSDGKFYLNQLPALSNFNALIDDVLAIVNVGGDGSSNNGYWKEVWRQISVK